MDEILKSFSSPAWWFSAVIVALVINIISSYLKPQFDRFFSSIFISWRNRSSTAKLKYEERVRMVSKDTDLQIIYLLEAVTHRSRSIGWLTVVVIDGLFLLASLQVRLAEILVPGVSPVVSASWFSPSHLFVMLGLIAIVGSMRCTSAALDREQLVRQARFQVSSGVV